MSARPDLVETSSAGEVSRTSGLSANNETLVESMELGSASPNNCDLIIDVRDRPTSEARISSGDVERTRLG